MSVNIKHSPLWKYGAGKMRFLGLGMALLLVVFMAGCSSTPSPSLSAIAPSSGIQGAAVAVTLTGTNFATGSTVSLSGTGITVSNVTLVSSTSITATFTIAATAPTGAQNVTVTSRSKISGSQAFTVNSGAATLTSVSPSSGAQGQSVNVTLTGTLFTAGSTVAVSGTGVTVSNTTVVSSTSITATFTIALNATTGAQNVTVTNASGPSGTQTFTVTALPPTVTFTNPAVGATSIPINRKIAATFSKPMTSATITTATFTLVGGGTNVAGTVTYDAANNIATFAPTANLTASTVYTATVTTGAKDLSGTSLASSFVWTFTTGATADTTAPTVISTNPASAATGVALNQKIAATFSKVMDSATLTTTTFTLMQGTTAVAGTVTYVGTTATFTPTANLTASKPYTATITTGAKDLSVPANALASNFVWSFTTGTASNATAPTVTSTVPLNAATGVNLNQAISATFSTGMDPATISTLTFTLAGPGTTSVSGTVTCNSGCTIATFTPNAALTMSATFTATVTTGAKDLAGNALAANKVWTFMTGTTTGTGPVNLGSAGTFAGAMGGAAGETNMGINTVVNGDMSTTGASTTVTGFHDTAGCVYTETTLNIGSVNGTIYTAAPPPGGAAACATTEGTANTAAIATKALADAQTAFNTLAGLPAGADPGAQLGGQTLGPAVYKTSGGAFMITLSDLTLDAKGDANAVWVFQMATSLTVGDTAPRNVILINGAQAKNVYWQVGSAATINGAGGGTMVGTIIAQSGVTFSTAGNAIITTLNGRALALSASVTMVNTVINVPLP
jgi:hypothetical protein